MSSTNKTTNYELSQFLGTDKPAWLSDYNTDMSKIDAQMKLNADGVTSAAGSATTANTNIGTLASLTTEAKTSVVAAINEVDSNADTAQGTANSAALTANTAKSEADGIAAYLAITNYGNVESTDVVINAGSIGGSSVSYASNAAGTLGKVYGSIVTVAPTSASTVITIKNLPFDVDSDFSVKGLCVAQVQGDKTIYMPSLNFKTNGTATIEFGAGFNGLTINIFIMCSLIFIQNFGDQPA